MDAREDAFQLIGISRDYVLIADGQILYLVPKKGDVPREYIIQNIVNLALGAHEKIYLSQISMVEGTPASKKGDQPRIVISYVEYQKTRQKEIIFHEEFGSADEQYRTAFSALKSANLVVCENAEHPSGMPVPKRRRWRHKRILLISLIPAMLALGVVLILCKQYILGVIAIAWIGYLLYAINKK